MKKGKLLFTALFTAGIVATLVACNSHIGGNVDTGDKTDDPQQSDTDNLPPDAIRTDKTEFTFRTGDSELVISVKDNVPYVTSLKTLNSGVNRATDGTAYSLPGRYETTLDMNDFEWKFEGYKAFTGDGGEQTVALCFTDANIAASYELHVITREMNGPFELVGYMTNSTGTPIEFIPGNYSCVSVKGEADPVCWTFDKESGQAEGSTLHSGSHFDGTGIYKTVVSQGVKVAAANTTYQDWNQGGHIPMMYLDYGSHGIYYAIEWSNARLQSKGKGNGEVELSGKLSSVSFVTTVPDGDVFFMPPIYLGVYDGDTDDGSNVFKRWFLNCKAPDCMLTDPNEPLTQQDMQIGYNVAQYGINSIKWDYGWWSDTLVGAGPWRTNEGLLEVKNSAYLGVLNVTGCADLPAFVKKANEAGVSVAIYALLKDTMLDLPGVPTSVGENGHPEWFSYINITGSGKSADLGNTECVAFFQQYMTDFFNETGIKTWRSDFEPITRDSDKENRHDAKGSDVQYWCTVGFGELVDYLYDNIDGFRYESCSSGGSMKDFFTMTKAAVINCDDSADYMSLHMSFYDSSYCIHPAQLMLPIDALTYTPGSANYTAPADYEYGLRCAITGAVMLSNWSGTQKIDTDHWTYYIKDLYNTRLKPLIREGDLYHILPRPDGIHWDGLQYVDADTDRNDKSCVMLWKPTGTEGATKTVRLRGLNPDTTYQLTFEDRTEQNTRMTGKALMESGIAVTISEETGSEIIWLSVAK